MTAPTALTTLDQWLAYIAGQHAQVMELGLDRVARVLARMELPRSRLGRVITVAGTNGKGTTVAAIERLLAARGHRVVAYSSPHLLRYNERVRLNGADADDASLCRGFAAVDKARGDIPLTYFEFGTLAALHCFAEVAPDYCLLEVGLGGRLDAVNVVDADVAVITTIDIDHVDWLGTDRETIAREKAGILRSGASFFCGDPAPPQALSEIANALDVRGFWRGRNFFVESLGQGCWRWRGENGAGAPVVLDDLPPLAIPVDNAALALQVVSWLDELAPAEQVRALLPAIQMPGRFQQVCTHPDLVLDVGHNPQAARYLRDRVQARAGRWNALFSALADKDITQVVSALAGDIEQWYCAPLTVERAATLSQLQAAFAAAGVTRVLFFKSFADAFDSAMEHASAQDHLLAFGSFFTVAETQRLLDAMAPAGN